MGVKAHVGNGHADNVSNEDNEGFNQEYLGSFVPWKIESGSGDFVLISMPIVLELEMMGKSLKVIIGSGVMEVQATPFGLSIPLRKNLVAKK